VIIEIYAIKDKKIGLFQNPFFCTSIVVALRNLAIALDDPKSNLVRFAQDYALFKVGTFDDLAGETLPPQKGPELVTELLALIDERKANHG